ncbi:hypothetical protein V8F20_010257 [Naviculisporaceae sp. PSN 640]
MSLSLLLRLVFSPLYLHFSFTLSGGFFSHLARSSLGGGLFSLGHFSLIYLLFGLDLRVSS